jgi:putative FmdB family regulatory protein
MPLYEYQCTKCGHRFERIQSFSADDVKECPVCQGPVERLISTPARPQFKGSGFYSTDYVSKPAASSSTPTESSTTPAAKTESTPAPAAAPATPSKSD